MSDRLAAATFRGSAPFMHRVTRSTMADEGPPPNDGVVEDAEENGEEEDEEGDVQPRLIERIANDDPAVSTLNLTSFWELGEPKFDSDEVTEAVMAWWGELDGWFRNQGSGCNPGLCCVVGVAAA